MTAWSALAATLLIEVPLAALLFPGLRKRIAVVALVANAVTNLALNVGLPWLGIHGDVRILLGETAALVLEAAAYALASREIARSVVASAAGNLLSFTVGGVLVHLMAT